MKYTATRANTKASTHDMMKRVASLSDSRHHCQRIFFVMYTSNMNGRTSSPHQLFTQ